MKKIFIICNILFISISVIAQNIENDLLAVISIQTEKINKIHAISEDDSGYIWLATDKGLFTFDGNTLSKFNRVKPLIRNASYSSVMVDSKNRVWAGTYSQGLICINLNNNKITEYKHRLNDSLSLADNRVKLIFEDKNGAIWVGSHTSGLNKLNEGNHLFEHFLPSTYFPDNNKRNIDEFISYKNDPVNKNIFWIGSLDGLLKFDVNNNTFELFHCDKNTIKQKNSFTGYENEGRNINFTEDGLILGTWGGGICKVDTVTKIYDSYKFESTDKISHLRNNVLYSILNKDKKLLVTIADKGTLEYTHKNRMFKRISENLLTKYYVDSKGQEWYVFDRNKLFVKPRQSTLFNSCIYDQHITTCYKDNNKIYYSKYQETNINVFDTKTSSVNVISYIPNNNIGFNWVGDIYKTPKGELIIQESKDLYILKDGKISLFFDLASLKDQKVFLDDVIMSSIIDEDNEIWIGQKKRGILRINQNELSHKYYTEKDGMSNSRWISTLFEDNNQRIWYGSEKSLGFIDKKDNHIYNITDSTKSNLYVSSIFQSSDSTIWVGEDKSILKIKISDDNSYKIKNITPPQLIGNSLEINAIDSQGNIWGSSSLGLFYFDTSTEIFKFWDSTYGFKSISNLTLYNKDSMYVATRNKILKGRISDLFFDDKKATLNYTYLKLFNKEINYQDKPMSQVKELNFGYKQNFITVGFGLLDVLNPESLNFEYKLEDQNNSWIQLGKRNYVEFLHLNPGRYKLQIRQINIGHNPVYSNVLKINIQAPFWQTWWFKLFVLLVIALGFFAYFSRKNKKVKLEFEKQIAFQKQLANVEMLALRSQMNPHFIFNCMNTIKLFVKEDRKEKASKYIGDFAKLMRMALNNSRVNLILLSEELEHLRLYIEMEKMRFEQRIDSVISFPDGMDLKQYQVPPMLIQPFVENAIKHGILPLKRKGKLIIDVKKEANYLIYIIQDNGIGRKASIEKNKGNHLPKSLGINITNDRLKLIKTIYGMQASIDIIDLEKDGIALGTKVIVRIPVILRN